MLRLCALILCSGESVLAQSGSESWESDCAVCPGPNTTVLLTCTPSRDTTCQCAAGFAGTIVAGCEECVAGSTFARFDGMVQCYPCSACAGTDVTLQECTTTTDRTCTYGAGYGPGMQAASNMTARLAAKRAALNASKSAFLSASASTMAADNARVVAEAAAIEAAHISMTQQMASTLLAKTAEWDSTISQRVATAAQLDLDHLGKTNETTTLVSETTDRVAAAMNAKDTEAARVTALRQDQLEEHTSDAQMMAGQRDVYAAAAAAQKALLDAAVHAGSVAPELTAAEGVIDATQTIANYDISLPTSG